ncbi:MAG: hypothetical protein ACHQ49_03055 [Elusimicrobiota bacterium]
MATAAKPRNRKAPVRAQLSVDYPRQGETVTGPYYAIRVNAPEEAESVQVAVDLGEWRPCRPSAGFWWCDWSGYESGEHAIAARLVTLAGKTFSSVPHGFFVQLEKRPA